MPLMQREKWVRAVNTDSKPRTLHDMKGKFDMPPYDGTDLTVINLPGDVFHRWYRYSWLARASEPAAVQEEADVPAMPELKMNEIRARLREAGITLPMKTTKAAALACLAGVVQKG